MRQRIKQHGVHIIAHAKSEEANIFGRGTFDVVQNLVSVGHAARRQPIGQEDDDGRAFIVLHHVHCFEQSFINVRAAFGSDQIHPARGITRFAHRLKLVGITLCASAEGDDVESIFAVKILQDVSKRVFRLRNFLPLHTARLIQNQNHIFRNNTIGLGINAGRSE